jgi:WD40 repeat protein
MIARRISGNKKSVTCMAVSHDLQVVASGSGYIHIHGQGQVEPDTEVEMMIIARDKVLRFECEEAVTSLDFSRDGDMLATGSAEGTIKVWALSNAGRPKLTKTLTGLSGRLWSIKFSNDGQMISSMAEDNKVRIWSVKTGKLLLTYSGHKGGAQYAAWSSDDKRVASLGYDYTVLLWDAVTGKPLMAPLTDLCDGVSNSPADLLSCNQYHRSTLAFGTQAPILVSSGSGTIAIWDLCEEGQATLRFKFSSPPGYALRITLSPDDQYIASWAWGVDSSIRVWDVGTGKQCRQLAGHRKQLQCVEWSRDSKHLLSGDTDSSLCFWTMHEEVWVYTYISCVCMHMYTWIIHTLHTYTPYIQMICTWIIHIKHTLHTHTSYTRIISTRAIHKDDRSYPLMVHVKTMQVIHINPHLEPRFFVTSVSRLLSPSLATPQLCSWACLKPFVKDVKRETLRNWLRVALT